MIKKACARCVPLDAFILETAETDEVGQEARDVGNVVEPKFGRSIESLYGDVGSAVSMNVQGLCTSLKLVRSDGRAVFMK